MAGVSEELELRSVMKAARSGVEVDRQVEPHDGRHPPERLEVDPPELVVLDAAPGRSEHRPRPGLPLRRRVAPDLGEHLARAHLDETSRTAIVDPVRARKSALDSAAGGTRRRRSSGPKTFRSPRTAMVGCAMVAESTGGGRVRQPRSGRQRVVEASGDASRPDRAR
jgi:hypothetical protein